MKGPLRAPPRPPGSAPRKSTTSPVTIGLTRAAKLDLTSETLTAQHMDALASPSPSCTLLTTSSLPRPRSTPSAHLPSRNAAAEARLAEEISRRREADADRDEAPGRAR
jgi:hypothetical protein